MGNENAKLDEFRGFNEELIADFDFEELQEKLEIQLEQEFADLEFLKEEREKIGEPEALGKVILDEVWKQFGNQIGLELTGETLINKYDKEHPEELTANKNGEPSAYDEKGRYKMPKYDSKTHGAEVMKDPRYREANKSMREKQEAGNLKDTYTGKDIKREDKANLDHVVSRKELFENLRRKQAGLTTSDVANIEENLRPTNESLNKSKKDKSVNEFLEKREEREKNQIKQNERANKKIDDSNMSETEKRKAKEKNNKRLKDKQDANSESMKETDKQARKAINKEIANGVVKETGKKAATDALKAMAIQALFDLLKEIMNALVRFLKSSAKSFKNFLDEMKVALTNFFSKITSYLRTGVSTVVSTIVTEIFGPIVVLFKKLATAIKQGIRSIGDAISYLKDKENKDKPFAVKVAEVGKIVVAGLTALGAIFGGEALEALITEYCAPLAAIKIPLLGSLASLIGTFLASMICGVVGAIIINLIDKFIAKRQKEELLKEQIKKKNDIINLQHQVRIIDEVKLDTIKVLSAERIKNRHEEAAIIMKKSIENIMNNCREDKTIDDTLDDIDNLFKELECE